MIYTGDKKIINFLFEEFFARGCEFANSIINEREESYDIVQSLFIKLWEKKLTFKSISLFKSYLYNSIKNTCLNYLRDKRSFSNEDIDVFEHSVEYSIIDIEIKSEILNCIEQLPEVRKKVVLLKLDNYSLKDISEELKLSFTTVRTHSYLANKQLRKLLKDVYVLMFF